MGTGYSYTNAIEPGAAEEGIIGAVIRRDHGVGGASRPPLRVSVNLGCNLVPLMWSRPAFDSRLNLRPSGGSTRTSADVSVPRGDCRVFLLTLI